MQILCFGDSNTYGYDPRGYFGGRYDAEDRWVDLLAKHTGHTCINAGVNGREIPRSPYPAGADLFLVMLGTNDLLQGASPREAAGRMEAFLKSMLPSCKQILLVAPPPLKQGSWVCSDTLVANSFSLAEEYKAVSERLHIAFLDTRNWNIALAFDGVHFTEAGHHTFADCLAKQLLRKQAR